MIYGGYYANIYYAHISLIVSEMKQVPSAKCHYKQAIESLTHKFIYSKTQTVCCRVFDYALASFLNYFHRYTKNKLLNNILFVE